MSTLQATCVLVPPVADFGWLCSTRATPGASSSNEKRHIAPSLTRPLSVRAPTAAQLAAGTLGGKGKGKATAVTLGQDIGGEVESVPGQDRWGRAPLPSLSKKERKAVSRSPSLGLDRNSLRRSDTSPLYFPSLYTVPRRCPPRRQRHAPTAGPKWFDMPAPVMTPELKREVQAMRLRNALDPKRFYKGGSKDSQLPEFFQVGHVLESSQRATNAREGKTRKRTFVEELLEDDKAKAYAKRKFQDEVMVKGMSGRKNKHMTKRGGRKR